MLLKVKKFPSDVVYKEKQYIILSKDDVVLWSGNKDEFLKNSTIKTGYYDDLYLTSRKHDLYLNDNSKLVEQPNKDELKKSIKILDEFNKTMEIKKIKNKIELLKVDLMDLLQ